MRPFHYGRAADAAAATRDAVSRSEATVQFLAGGTTLIDLMKLDVVQPQAVIDITSIDDKEMSAIHVTSNGVKLGSLVTMAEAAADPAIRRDYPIVAQSLELAASAQLRNMARLGGNLLQRTRCPYFRDVTWACNKREPGAGCSAIGGFNRLHAVLGTSPSCIASYPGDFAQALMALDASVETVGQGGRRAIPIADLHRLPGNTPHVETSLTPGELITAIVIPAGAWTRRSTYLKIRDRASYAFALTSAAVALELTESGNEVIEARIAVGGLATVPWRAREAESMLRGRVLDDRAMTEAASAALAGAQPQEHNAFKIELGKQTIVRALKHVQSMEI